YDDIDPEARKRIKEALDIKEHHGILRDDLNSFNNLLYILNKSPPSMAWHAKNIKEHEDWAKKVKEKVKELVSYENERVDLEVEEGPETNYKNIKLKKYYFNSAPGMKVAAVLAHPIKMDEPRPGIICVHGHNKGKINTLGLAESSSNSYYGIELAMKGYVTLSLDQWGWGERRGQAQRAFKNSESAYSLSALLLGKTAIGFRCWDVTRSIDFLKTLDLVNDKFGVIGQSGGGTTAAFSSVLDDRIDAAVVSGYFCSWDKSIFSLNHCSCNFVPGIMRYINMADLMGARAPKPTFIVSGEKDRIFPQDGVQDAYGKLKKIYNFLNAPDNLQIDVIKDTGHVFRGKFAYPWLDKVLLNSNA
ncbi:MAG: alpha/beta hydrolase family protein, partial [Promethearchaeota archaeon]